MRRRTRWLGTRAAVCVLVVAGCDDGGFYGDADADSDTDTGPDDCFELDFDGYGNGSGCLGPDCDDTNPEAWTDEQCQALCAVDPHSTGCSCTWGDTAESCYLGPDGTEGVGRCRSGQRTCGNGESWSICAQQVLPRPEETCDGTDDDCDGETDEGC